MAPLASQRSQQQAFIHTGLDYCGPFYVDVSIFDPKAIKKAEKSALPSEATTASLAPPEVAEQINLATTRSKDGRSPNVSKAVTLLPPKVVKRGRGRPKKNSSATSNDVLSAASQKRGRGRPPKVKVVSPSLTDDPIPVKDRKTTSKTNKSAPASQGTTLVKRGRGRPIKNPKPKKQGRTMKLYILLFTCMSTRAVHLEICHDMTTAGLINALQRFFSRRGYSRHLYSDNGSQLVYAAAQVKRLYAHLDHERIQKFLLEMPEPIQWHFSAPLAPWQGGAFERMVGSVKVAIAATVASAQVDYEKFRTLVCKAESIVNARPLYAASEDVRDGNPITPAHLILGRSLTTLPEDLAMVDLKAPVLFQWHRRIAMEKKFWDTWQQHYLTGLQTMSKWLTPGKEPKVGDIVLFKPDNAPKNRFQWPLAKIKRVFPSPKDGRIRNVEIFCRNTLYNRDIRSLYRLEAMLD
jgi:hypothetical protein